MSFSTPSTRGDLLETFFIEGTCATAFHLLKEITTFDVTHKEQTFKRFYICTCGYHGHRDCNTRIIAITEVSQYGFGRFTFFSDFTFIIDSILTCFIGYFFAELVAFTEFLSDNINNIVSVAVAFSEN